MDITDPSQIVGVLLFCLLFIAVTLFAVLKDVTAFEVRKVEAQKDRILNRSLFWSRYHDSERGKWYL